jgi:hypothetical protein
MSKPINATDANRILLEAFNGESTVNDDIVVKIKLIILGTHKTYKYILVTGLLAKATNNDINSLSLQANAPLVGAYDARSLCHNVVVPFERNHLQKALGGSNEPFLNKPARFTHLSTDNAVRAGKDKIILQNLIDVLSSLKNSDEACEYLTSTLELLKKQIEKLDALSKGDIKINPTLVEVYRFILRMLEKSFQGESLVLIVATLESIYYSKLGKQYKVVAHKVNQSGASSKEIGDIDIFEDEQYLYSLEIKDKDFTVYDVEHAFDKMKEAGGYRAEFIYGQNASYHNYEVDPKLIEYENDGFFTLLHYINDYCKHTLVKIELNDRSHFVNELLKIANDIYCKQETLEWIQELLKEFKWK